MSHNLTLCKIAAANPARNEKVRSGGRQKKANLFALIKNRVFDKMYVIKNFRRFSWIATRV